MTDREMIEARCKQDDLTILGWDEEHENGLTAKLGQWVVSTPDYDDDGLYEGDEGELTACVVGAEKYGNRRVSFSFTPDGYDGGVDGPRSVRAGTGELVTADRGLDTTLSVPTNGAQ